MKWLRAKIAYILLFIITRHESTVDTSHKISLYYNYNGVLGNVQTVFFSTIIYMSLNNIASRNYYINITNYDLMILLTQTIQGVQMRKDIGHIPKSLQIFLYLHIGCFKKT